MTPQSGHLEIVTTDGNALRVGTAFNMETGPDKLILSAAELARNLAWIPGQQESRSFRDRCETLTRAFRPVLASVQNPAIKPSSENFERCRSRSICYQENWARLVNFQRASQTSPGAHFAWHHHSKSSSVSQGLSRRNGYQFSQASFAAYIHAFQQITVLKMARSGC